MPWIRRQATIVGMSSASASSASDASSISPSLSLYCSSHPGCADGRPDLLVGQVNWTADGQELPHYVNIIRNQMPAKNNWVGVRLHEHGPGQSPIGATVKVLYDGQSAVRHVVTGDSWRAQHSGQKHFGLGATKLIEAIEVRWPNGKTSRLTQPAINQYHEVKPE